MKYGINLYLWADDMHDRLMPVLEKLKKIGYDGVEVPIFDLDPAKWKLWSRRLDDLGLERTANTVIAPEHNPLSADPAIREAAYDHLRAVVDCCATVGSSILCGPHQVALGVFTGRGATDEEWKRCVEHLRRVAEYAAGAGVVLAEEVVNRFELYHVNTLDQGIRLVDEVGHPNCRLHLDTFHAHIEEKNTADAIRRAGDRIAHVHVSENDRGVPGTGSVAWDAAFGALGDVGYNGWLTVEAFGNFLPNLAAATKIWRPLFDSEDQLAADALAFLTEKTSRR
ncbi:MAG TPA: sugar phosphate isomerase/epimerase family protein [Candidatus Nitrosopolaris sp.]|nr:sugar phosphate isomerase/epimerase family protein [Candidatus Nitrosopolaris sp.]